MSQCAICPQSIPKHRVTRGSITCSPACAKEAAKTAYRSQNPVRSIPLSKPQVVAWNRATVAADLVRHGYEVYWPLGPGELAVRNGKVLVDVAIRAGHKTTGGLLAFSPKHLNADVVAAVYPDGSIDYFPDISNGLPVPY